MNREDLIGKIYDVDSHESILPTRWHKHFGKAGARVAPMATKRLRQLTAGMDIGLDSDASDIHSVVDADTVKLRGFHAPGSEDMGKRVEVMNHLGIKRQIVFPFYGAFALVLEGATPENFDDMQVGGEDGGSNVIAQIGKTLLKHGGATYLSKSIQRSHNQWAKGVSQEHGARLAPVAVVRSSKLSELLVDTQQIIDDGLPSLLVSCGILPGGFSPGHKDLDPFWAMCAKANLPIYLHVGGDRGFKATERWRELPQLQSRPSDTGEVPLDAFSLDTMFLPARNFVSSMVLGGVFERHPTLRLGIIELGASWIGPMAESLDMYTNVFAKTMANVLSLKPSEYINRNIRASAFWFEPVDKYIERYGLEDVYCFASDYPHPEGGKDPIQAHLDRLNRLGNEVVNKFFCTNAQWIMPEVST